MAGQLIQNGNMAETYSAKVEEIRSSGYLGSALKLLAEAKRDAQLRYASDAQKNIESACRLAKTGRVDGRKEFIDAVQEVRDALKSTAK
jgi:hypothetical protein